MTGESFPELARRLVLEPAGMSASTYEQPLPDRLSGTAAAGHRTGAKPVSGHWHVYPEQAAAGLWTTPADLMRFVLAIQGAHAGAPGALLPSDLTRELLTPQAPNASMGLGLLVAGEGPTKRFQHGGDDQGFVAWASGFVERGDGVAVMTNSDAGMWVIEPLLEAVAREYGWPNDDKTVPAGATEREAEACAGRYVADDARPFGFEHSEGRLLLHIDGQEPVELVPASAFEWHAVPLRLTVAFERADDGRPVTAILHQDAEYVEDVQLTRID